MGRTRILELCKEGKLAQAALSPYVLPYYDKVVFLDRGRGDDGNDGMDWGKAVRTINAAQLLFDAPAGLNTSVNAGCHFAILYRGQTTTGRAFTAAEGQQILSVQGVDLIGAMGPYGSGSHGSCFVYGTDPTGLKVTAHGCRVLGMKLYMITENTETDPKLLTIQDGISMGLFDSWLIGANSNGDVSGKSTVGVRINGAEALVMERNLMEYLKNGIVVSAGASRYTHKSVVRDNVLMGCENGVYFENAQATENLFEENRILPKTTYGYTLTRGFHLAAVNPSGNTFRLNFVGHDTKANAYYKGSGTNYWDRNYFEGSGGTLYDGS